MKKSNKVVLLAIGMLVFTIGFGDCLAAMEKPKPPEGYPKRKIESIVPWGAGGGSDRFARHFVKTVKKHLGLDIVVTNHPGAGGVTGVNYYMGLPADGYSIVTMSDIIIVHNLLGHIKYAVDDFAHIARITHDVDVLSISPDNKKFSDVKGMIKWAKKHPKFLTVAVEGYGGIGDLECTGFENVAGYTAVHVPYSKLGPRVAAVIGGHIDVLWEQAGDILPYVQGGKLKPIVSFSKERMPRAPYNVVPCSVELGYNFIQGHWRSIGFKKGTDPKIVKYMTQVVEYYMNTPEAKELQKKHFLDLRPAFLGGEALEKWLRDEKASFKDSLETLGILKK